MSCDPLRVIIGAFENLNKIAEKESGRDEGTRDVHMIIDSAFKLCVGIYYLRGLHPIN